MQYFYRKLTRAGYYFRMMALQLGQFFPSAPWSGRRVLLPHNPFLSYLQWEKRSHCVKSGFQNSLWLTSNYKFPKNERYQPNEIGKFIFPKPKRKFMLQNVSQGKIPSAQQCTRALTSAQISAACFDILDVLSTLCISLLCMLRVPCKIQKQSKIRQ